eukprot:gnl/TRDRNA2_/TRDRNA2_55661_c0_seq1.p1 gnl/TRDRNA2_/TRDRNA2_55661_c0~~gnl/TRDRNA2_/TRDRNA2_55661_c0_seq1.p1  ORF type:complete len:322 (-),score=50.02 gnl/TRDRNA2_/TRDRNA2_55661_c0_seq1:47-1012(-)
MIVAEKGEVECKHEEQSSISAMTFLPNGSLALAAYGGVRVLGSTPEAGETGKGNPKSSSEKSGILLERSAASVQCVAASPDGKQLAAGCLDKAVRVFTLGSKAAPVDWIGFNGPVVTVSWSVNGSMLGACAGNSVLVTEQGAARGEAPILCRGAGVPEAESTLGSCPRLTTFAWCPSKTRENILAASSTRGSALVFDVNASDYAFPRRCTPLLEVRPPGAASGTEVDLLMFSCEGENIMVGVDDQVASFAFDKCVFANKTKSAPNISLTAGSEVTIAGLASRPELNSKNGILVKYCREKGRWQVKTSDGSVLLKASNLKRR